MDTIYVTQERCTIRREGEHIKVTRLGETLNTVPIHGLKTLVLFDSVQLTTQALNMLLGNGIDIIYMSKAGKLKGRILAAKGGGAILRLAQYSAFLNVNTRLGIAKSIVTTKINNQASIIKKYKYHDTNSQFNNHLLELQKYTELVDTANTIEEIMGVEGISARYYWYCFRHLLKNPVFKRREYRPSPDYVNALLNMGYAFLAIEISTCLIAQHFDSEIGFLHSIRYGRNSLALDLMEGFRPIFVDAWILSLVNKKQIRPEHFCIVNGDYRLSDEGFHKFCTLYHERVPNWRGKFHEQTERLKIALLKGGRYEPYCE